MVMVMRMVVMGYGLYTPDRTAHVSRPLGPVKVGRLQHTAPKWQKLVVCPPEMYFVWFPPHHFLACVVCVACAYSSMAPSGFSKKLPILLLAGRAPLAAGAAGWLCLTLAGNTMLLPTSSPATSSLLHRASPTLLSVEKAGAQSVVEGSPASGGRVSRPTIATHRGLGSGQTWDLSIGLHQQDSPYPKFYLRNA